jgi:TonB family protein
MKLHITSINPAAALLLVILNLTLFSVNAQQPIKGISEERDRGIQLYQQGDAKGAIELLRQAVKLHKDDLSAWHYLGLSFGQAGKQGDALKAHEKAAKIAETLLTNSLDRAVTLPKNQLMEAADSADQYLLLSVNPERKQTEEWRDRAEFLRVFAIDPASLSEVYSAKEVTTKVRILSKAEAHYTEQARQDQIKGTVVLRCVLAADGHVRGVRVVAGLGGGLTLRAIVAAQHIKFIPAIKDGHPVSMWMMLEYNFNLY